MTKPIACSNSPDPTRFVVMEGHSVRENAQHTVFQHRQEERYITWVWRLSTEGFGTGIGT